MASSQLHSSLSQWSALVLTIQVFQASLIASSWEVADFQRTEEGLGKKKSITHDLLITKNAPH